MILNLGDGLKGVLLALTNLGLEPTKLLGEILPIDTLKLIRHKFMTFLIYYFNLVISLKSQGWI